jgi:GAF domain-containing protein
MATEQQPAVSWSCAELEVLMILARQARDAIEDRGFDTAKARQEAQDTINDLFEKWLEARGR